MRWAQCVVDPRDGGSPGRYCGRRRSGSNASDKMRFSMLVSFLRPIGPVVIGISLGFTLSLLSVSWVDESCNFEGKDSEDVSLPLDSTLKGARRPSSISTNNDADSEEDFEPRIVPYKQVQQSSNKKLFR